eukprot:3728552-Amphidinium_carterae.1
MHTMRSTSVRVARNRLLPFTACSLQRWPQRPHALVLHQLSRQKYHRCVADAGVSFLCSYRRLLEACTYHMSVKEERPLRG